MPFKCQSYLGRWNRCTKEFQVLYLTTCTKICIVSNFLSPFLFPFFLLFPKSFLWEKTSFLAATRKVLQSKVFLPFRIREMKPNTTEQIKKERNVFGYISFESCFVCTFSKMFRQLTTAINDHAMEKR